MRLADNFTLAEMTRTGHREFLAENRQLAMDYLGSLRATAAMLQTIRDHYNAPLFVHSGFRCPDLNAAIGGSETSQHPKGEAADFHVACRGLTEVWEWIAEGSGIEFGQLILEGWAAGNPSWIHLSLGPPWRPPEKSGQVYTWVAGQGYTRIR